MIRAVDRIGDEEAAEQQDLRRKEQPDPELPRVELLFFGLEVVL